MNIQKKKSKLLYKHVTSSLNKKFVRNDLPCNINNTQPTTAAIKKSTFEINNLFSSGNDNDMITSQAVE